MKQILTKCNHCNSVEKIDIDIVKRFKLFPKGVIKIISTKCEKCQDATKKTIYSKRYLTNRMRYLLHQKCKNIEGLQINARDQTILVPSGYDVTNKNLLKLINDFDYTLAYIIPERPLFFDDENYIFIKKIDVFKVSNDQLLGELIRKKL
jgi:hypothetical protein